MGPSCRQAAFGCREEREGHFLFGHQHTMVVMTTLEEESIAIDRALQVLSTVCQPSISGIPEGAINKKIIDVNRSLRIYGARWRTQYGKDETCIYIDQYWTSCPVWVKKMVESLCCHCTQKLYPHIRYAVHTHLPEIYLQIKRGEWTPLPDEDFTSKDGCWGVPKKAYVRPLRQQPLREMWFLKEVGEGAATSGDLIRVQEVFGGKEEEKPDFSKRRYQPELPIFHFDIHNSYPLVSLELKRGLK